MLKEKLIETYRNEKELNHVLDYINSEYPNKKNINFTFEQALQKTNDWVKKLNSIKNLTIGKVEIIKDLGDGFSLVHLKDQDSKNYEGSLMGHCVASYKDHNGIYSVRKQDLPVCTIEIKDETIQQIKGKANGKVSPKYINYCLDAIKHFNYKLSNNDIENLGYTNKIDLKFIKNHFSNYKIVQINNKEYLYTNNQLKVVKAFNNKLSDLLFYFCKYGQCFNALKMLIHNGADIHAENNYLSI